MPVTSVFLKPVFAFVELRSEVIFRQARFVGLCDCTGIEMHLWACKWHKNHSKPSACCLPGVYAGSSVRFWWWNSNSDQILTNSWNVWEGNWGWRYPQISIFTKSLHFCVIYLVRDYPENLSKKYSRRKKLVEWCRSRIWIFSKCRQLHTPVDFVGVIRYP